MPTESETFFLQTDLTVDEAMQLDTEMDLAEHHLREAVKVARKGRRWDLERYQKELLRQCQNIRRMTVPICNSARKIRKREKKNDEQDQTER